MGTNKKAKQFHSEISNLIGQGLTNPEISKELGLSIAQVAVYTQRFLGGNPNYLKKISKHKHLHEKILKMRLKYTDKEIMNKFSLTSSELKSCMTHAYKNKKLGHLRKDTRRRDAWSGEELRFLLKWSGIISQKEINDYLGRGNGRIVIKEKLQSLGLCSKNINGLTYSKFTSLFNVDPLFILETSAGSPASPYFKAANWKLVPWCHVEEMLNDGIIDQAESIKIYVRTMASFQRWVHGKDYWRSMTSDPVFNPTAIKLRPIEVGRL